MAISISGDGITVANLTSAAKAELKSGRKNLIINGGMQVAQRGTSDTDANGYTTVDRFQLNKTGASMTYKSEQVSDAPDGFYYSHKVTITAINTTTTDHRCSFMQHIEGYNIDCLEWGSSTAKDVTLSFWVKSTETGTFGGVLLSQNNSGRVQSFSYTISSANTWEKKTITITGDTGGDCWGNQTNNAGLQVRLSLGTASGRQVATGSWFTGGADFGATGEKDITTILNATLQVTGVQLELGDTATDFEHRSFGEELALCQRYYQTHGTGSNDGYMGASGSGYATGAGQTRAARWTGLLPVPMRVAPTFNATLFSGGNCVTGYIYTLTTSVTWYPTSSAAGSCYFAGDFNLDAEL